MRVPRWRREGRSGLRTTWGRRLHGRSRKSPPDDLVSTLEDVDELPAPEVGDREAAVEEPSPFGDEYPDAREAEPDDTEDEPDPDRAA